MALDRVQVMKQEWASQGGQPGEESSRPKPIEPQEDAMEAAGLYLQDATHRDETTLIDRNGTSMRFKDGLNPSGLTLSDLAGSGDVDGPGSSTLNAVPRFTDTSGKIIKNSNVTIDDTGNIATPGTVDGRDVSADGTTLTNHVASTSNPHATTAAQVGALAVGLKGAANGVAELDATSFVPDAQIPPSITRDSELSNHANNTANPHQTKFSNLVPQTLADLNNAINDGNVDFAGTARPPTAHASTHQDGGSDEISVAGLSGVLADPQNPASHKTSHQLSGSDQLSVAGLTGLLATAQTPILHASTHQLGGTDVLSVAGLSGLLATAQNPVAHKTSHQSGGADQLSVAGLSGVLADAQNANKLQGTTVDVSTSPPADGQALAWVAATSKWVPTTIGGSVFGTRISNVEADAETSTTNAWQQKVLLTSPVGDPAGTYILFYSFEYYLSTGIGVAQARVFQDSLTTLAQIGQPDTNYQAYGGFKILTLTAGSHTFEIDFGRGGAVGTAYCRRARLVLWRIA